VQPLTAPHHQLLGRMLRSPLARRIPGNERLNAVDCLLPKFNKKTVEDVVKALMKGDDTMPPPGGASSSILLR